jgi:hypothetical protein
MAQALSVSRGTESLAWEPGGDQVDVSIDLECPDIAVDRCFWEAASGHGVAEDALGGRIAVAVHHGRDAQIFQGQRESTNPGKEIEGFHC